MWKWIPIPVHIFRIYEEEQYSRCLSLFVSSKLQYPMSSQVSKQSLPEGFYWPIFKYDGMLILLRSLYINPNLFLQPVIPQVGRGVLGPLKNEQINHLSHPSICMHTVSVARLTPSSQGQNPMPLAVRMWACPLTGRRIRRFSRPLATVNPRQQMIRLASA